MRLLLGVVFASVIFLGLSATPALAESNRPYFIFVSGIGAMQSYTSAWAALQARLGLAGYGTDDFEYFSYAGLSGSSTNPRSLRKPQAYDCRQVGQPLDLSSALLTDLLATRLQNFRDDESAGVGVRRDLTVVGHSLGGLVAIRAMEMLGERAWMPLMQRSGDQAFPAGDALLNFMWRHRENPRNPSVTRIVTFDSPIWGSGQFRNLTGALFAAAKDDYCKTVVLGSWPLGADLMERRENRDAYRQAWDERNGRPSVSRELGVQVITIGNTKDFLYNPIAWGRTALLAVTGAVTCAQTLDPALCLLASTGFGAVSEDNSSTQVMDIAQCCLWNLRDFGTDGGSPTRSHTVAMQNDEALDWLFEQANLGNSTQNVRLAQAAGGAAPAPAPGSAPQESPAVRMVRFSKTVRLDPNGSASKFGVRINLQAGDRFVARFTEQQNGDIRLYVTGPDGGTIYTAQQVKGPFETRVITVATPGQYTVWFDNGFSLVSGKTISLQVDYPER